MVHTTQGKSKTRSKLTLKAEILQKKGKNQTKKEETRRNAEELSVGTCDNASTHMNATNLPGARRRVNSSATLPTTGSKPIQTEDGLFGDSEAVHRPTAKHSPTCLETQEGR